MNKSEEKTKNLNKYELCASNAQFKNMEYNTLTADLRTKYGNGIVIKQNNNEDISISEALNIAATMLVLGATFGFVGYGIGGIVYAGFGACIGLFIGMVVDTLLLIIYSSGIGKPKAERVASNQRTPILLDNNHDIQYDKSQNKQGIKQNNDVHIKKD